MHLQLCCPRDYTFFSNLEKQCSNLSMLQESICPTKLRSNPIFVSWKSKCCKQFCPVLCFLLDKIILSSYNKDLVQFYAIPGKSFISIGRAWTTHYSTHLSPSLISSQTHKKSFTWILSYYKAIKHGLHGHSFFQ